MVGITKQAEMPYFHCSPLRWEKCNYIRIKRRIFVSKKAKKKKERKETVLVLTTTKIMIINCLAKILKLPC